MATESHTLCTASFGEHLRNALLGGSLLFWAGLAAVRPEVWGSPVRIAALVLQVCVAGLLIVRRPVMRNGDRAAVLAAVPSLAIGFLGSALAPPPDEWSGVAVTTFLVGIAIVLTAFATLGRRFSILPAARGLVTTGPYRIVRHPAYAGELLMLTACLLAGPSWWTALPLVAATAFLVPRILAEERLLDVMDAYAAYTNRVRWRLLPGIW